MSKLRIGLLLNKSIVDAWEYKIIEQIAASDFAEISLIINKKPSPKQTFITKFKDTFKVLLFSLFIRFDKKVFKVAPNAFQKKDISSLVQNVDIIEVSPISTKLSDRLDEVDLQKINSCELDVILRFGFNILRGDILKSAASGVWSFHHGDNRINRGGPAGVWEVLEGWPETGAILQILTEELDGGLVIERTYAKTDDKSVFRNNNNSYWKSLSMVLRNLKKLHDVGRDSFMSAVKAENSDPAFYYNKLFRYPTNPQIARLFIVKYFKIFVEKCYNLFYIDQWILLYRLGPPGEMSQSFFRFKKILPPKDRLWADPFVVFKDELHYVFFEEVVYGSPKGNISVLTIDKKGKISTPVKVLERDYHLSYPFVFSHNDTFYMIPETVGNRTIELYRCTEFPNKWELEKTLMKNVSAVDTTLHFHNNKYWMFSNVCENEGTSNLDELSIFYADDFRATNWQPHRRNPVISDVRKARPAGKIFKFKDNFYRPSQNSSKIYGRGMHVSKIVKLTEDEYEEVSIQDIFATWEKGMIATHTLNFDGNLTVIDAQCRRSRY